MPYAAITYADLKSALAVRLGDATSQFWSNAECGRTLIEALRTFNVLTGTWRRRDGFEAEAHVPFYDLPTVIPASRGLSVTDQDLVGQIEDNLLEPYHVSAWTGTTQFTDAIVNNTLAIVAAAIQRRRDQWLLETGMVVTNQVIPGPSRPASRVGVPAGVIDVRRASWIATDGTETPLMRDDEWALQAFGPGWNLSPIVVPTVFSVGTVPPLTLQVAPAPQVSGQLRLLAIETGAILDPTVGVLLGVPDDWTWAIRFGALADLLGASGPAQDAPRAAYCQARWQQAVQMAKGWNPVLAVQVDDTEVMVQSVQEADAFLPGWMAEGAPAMALVAGATVLALSPVADERAFYGITLDVLQNAPLPVNDTDLVQVAGEAIDTLLDYAVHLASFKLGGAEFAATQPLLDSFYRVCGVEVAHATAASSNRDALQAPSASDEAQRPREVSA